MSITARALLASVAICVGVAAVTVLPGSLKPPARELTACESAAAGPPPVYLSGKPREQQIADLRAC